jgi:hypothetical protein
MPEPTEGQWLEGIEHMEPERSRLVTDAPDPNCKRCQGRGMVGGCEGRHTPNPTHQHTISYCSCMNERYEEWDEGQTMTGDNQ